MKLRLLKVLFLMFYLYAILVLPFEALLIFTDADEYSLYKELSVIKKESHYSPISPEIDEFFDKSLRSYAKGESPRFLLLSTRLLEILYFVLIPFFALVVLQYIMVGKFNPLYSLRRGKQT